MKMLSHVKTTTRACVYKFGGGEAGGGWGKMLVKVETHFRTYFTKLGQVLEPIYKVETGVSQFWEN